MYVSSQSVSPFMCNGETLRERQAISEQWQTVISNPLTN